MFQEMIEFLESAKRLKEAWDEASDPINIIACEQFPLDKSYDDLVSDIELWVQKTEVELIKAQFEENKEGACLAIDCLKGRETNLWFEEGWFMKYKFKGDTIEIEDLEGDTCDLTLKEFDNCFILVEDSMYDLYVTLNKIGCHNEIIALQKMAHEIKHAKAFWNES